MKDTDRVALKKPCEQVLECQSNSKEMPKELVELQQYLKRLSGYVEKYSRGRKCGIGHTIPGESIWETAFSVKEDVSMGPAGVEVILLPPPEPISVISPPEDTDVGLSESDIGIYFINDVNPINLINVLQRELCSLKELCRSVGFIVQEMSKEFEHFKTCSGCLNKISPLLPDILKEVQELIKFMKKKRNESYAWPNDSEYLRKSTERLFKLFKKDDSETKGKIREETVGFVTIHTKSPKIVKQVESTILGEQATHVRSECTRQCRIRMIKHPQMSIFRSQTQNELRFIEKLKTLDGIEVVRGRGYRNKSVLTEFSTAQSVRVLHPVPTVERALQLGITGRVKYTTANGCADEGKPVTGQKSGKPIATQAKECLKTARVALGRACLALKHNGEKDTKKELKTNVKDLKDLVTETHKNQKELSKVLREKGVANTAAVELTDPKMLHQEKRGIEKAKKILSDGANMSEIRNMDELKSLVGDLKNSCDVKNRMIIALLNSLLGNVPKEQWEKLIHRVLREAGMENLKNFLPEPESEVECQDSKTFPRKELAVEEILSEREMKRNGRGKERTKPGKDRARISVSEVISKTSKCLRPLEGDTKSETSPTAIRGLKEMNPEGEKLLKDAENVVSAASKQRTEENKSASDESEAVNLTIKIADDEELSQYQSAVSFIQSGTTLTEKKSEMSLPTVVERDPEVLYIAGDAVRRRGSITGLSLKFKVPLSFAEDGDAGRNKPHDVKELSHELLQESLRSLTKTIDRMGVLTEKLSDDVYESTENFNDVANIYKLMSNLLSN